jgi:ABC-type transport system involved in cytochrome bd biosynthesis fused ATPase/permease subunit
MVPVIVISSISVIAVSMVASVTAVSIVAIIAIVVIIAVMMMPPIATLNREHHGRHHKCYQHSLLKCHRSYTSFHEKPLEDMHPLEKHNSHPHRVPIPFFNHQDSVFQGVRTQTDAGRVQAIWKSVERIFI